MDRCFVRLGHWAFSIGRFPMIAPLLALFGRSLREDARLKMTYVARVGLVLIILLFLLSVRGTFGWGNAPGLRFFSSVVYINFFFILLAGFSHFASAITEEKEEMTLGLLRMTNLNALSILLGKSTSRVVNALLLLAAQFPFTLLAISLGGVSGRQIVAAYCTLGAFIIFLANLALLASVICRRSTGAAVLTGVTLFVFFAAVPFLRWLTMLPTYIGITTGPSPAVSALGALADGVNLASPLKRLGAILATGFADSPVGIQVWSNLGLGLLCFLLAWALFEIFCNEQHEATQPRSLVAQRKSLFRGLGAGRAWQHALAWKDFHFLTGGKSWMAIKFVVYGLLLAAILWIPRRWNSSPNFKDFGFAAMWISIIIGSIETWFIAASFLRHERRWKTLSSLAMLPMSMRRIAYQKLLGCLPSLIPALTYFMIGLLCIFAGDGGDEFRWLEVSRWTLDGVLGFGLTIAHAILFLHLVALLSLYLKRGALPAAIAIYFVLSMFLGIIGSVFSRSETPVFFVMFTFSLGLIALFHWKIGVRLEALAEED